MKKVFKSAVMLMAAIILPMGFTSCSSDNNEGDAMCMISLMEALCLMWIIW